MELRRPKLHELPKLREIHAPFEDQFKFPDLALLSTIYVVVEYDQIIGFGTMQSILEVTVVLDQSRPAYDRMAALVVLDKQSELEAKEQGYNQIHAFIQDKKFANLMKNKFGYKKTKGKSFVKII